MTKQVVLGYVKTGLFWLTYVGLMSANLLIMGYLTYALYYEIYDPVYWRDHMTMYPNVDVEIPTSWQNKFISLRAILVFLVATVWGNYRLYKRKKYALWILAVYVYSAVGSILYVDVFHLGEWCPGYDFP